MDSFIQRQTFKYAVLKTASEKFSLGQELLQLALAPYTIINDSILVQMNRNDMKCVLTHFINAILVSGHLMRERHAAVQVSALRALR